MMERNLEAMAAKVHDIAIVGGGITGACIARDAALRGFNVALVDKGDFASATTAASSKLIHGGLRYLQNLELGLVRESLRERRIWSNTAPHLIDPIKFLMPTGPRRVRDRMMKAIGLTLYDWLAYDRNKLDDPQKAIPGHKRLSRQEALELEPGLESEGLTGAMVFYDYQMYSPERLALECIMSAAQRGAHVANYAEVVAFVREEDAVAGIQVRDVAPEALAGSDGLPRHYTVRAKVVINAAGPWADLLMAAVSAAGPGGADAGRHLIRSKGIHLITRDITAGHAIAVPSGSSHFFVLPWRGRCILGTTDTVYEGDPDHVHCSEKDIVDFLARVNAGYPGAKLVRSDVLHFYAGLRPIVDTTAEPAGKEKQSDETDSYSASRAAEVYDHESKEGVQGIITAVGGKWTTSRSLAEQVVDLAASKLEADPIECTTSDMPTFGGATGPFDDFMRGAVAKYSEEAAVTDEDGSGVSGRRYPPHIIQHLTKTYGARYEDVLALVDEDESLADRLAPGFPEIAAEVVYAARNEMALTVDDVLFRRTGLGTLGTPGEAVIDRVADLMAKELGWGKPQRTVHIERAVARFTSWARTRVIVNPRSWGYRTGARWPEIEAKLRHAIGPIETVFTDSPMAATRLTREALHDGMEQILVVGGDGTTNEVVNGFFENGEPINPEALLAMLTSATGGDFRKTLGLPIDIGEQIERLAASEIHCIDLGKLTCIDNNGNETIRYFDNVASFGLGGAVDQAVNNLTFARRFGGRFAFKWGTFKALVRYKNQPVRVQIDDVFDEEMSIAVGAVCNGKFFGGGMNIAPDASMSDGVFDVILVADIGKPRLLWNINSIYHGRHLDFDCVTALKGRKITAFPVDGSGEVLLDVDGETPGSLPATFEVIPSALFVRA